MRIIFFHKFKSIQTINRTPAVNTTKKQVEFVRV